MLYYRQVASASYARTIVVNEAECVHTEALHHGEAPRNGAIAERPHNHVNALRGLTDEVIERVMRRGRLRHVVVLFGLGSVHQI